jgi:hypothetical protein
MRRATWLDTPPIPRIVPAEVFDGFGWRASDRLEWGSPAGASLDLETPVTAANPPGMVFVLREPERSAFLPRELARLHVGGMGLTSEWALAPWAIDDATDLLYEHRAPPGEHLWLATGALAGLVWGLHDWAHFHNHGPFETPDQKVWTELQCDAAALAWTWANRRAVGLSDTGWEKARGEVARVAAARFAAEGGELDGGWLDAERVRALLPG